VVTCTAQIPFKAAYIVCGGDHDTSWHLQDNDSLFANGLHFASELLRGTRRALLEGTKEEKSGPELLEQLANALDGVEEVVRPKNS
jgi:hypothetical protein